MAIPAGYSLFAEAELEFGSKSITERTVEGKHRRFLCLRRACYGLVLLAVAGIVVFTHSQPAPQSAQSTLPTSLMPQNWQRETPHNVQSSPTGEMHIEDVVAVDSGEVLVLVRILPGIELPARDKISCQFRNASQFASSKPLAIHMMETDRAGILCGAPPAGLIWDAVEVDQKQAIRRGTCPLLWNANNLLVYNSVATEHDVVVFLHGISSSRDVEHFLAKQELQRLKKFQCIFNGHFTTEVSSQAQEVVRCAHPPKHLIPSLAGKMISLKFEGRLLPSLTVYNPASSLTLQPNATTHHDICACTMVYNSAKFLSEWIHYHAHLGVEKFFLYDNNSDDTLDEVIESLNPTFDVTKQPWPWVKTQEAGFSHCALMAQTSCTWMVFIDVDEYFFPHPRFLSPRSTTSRLASFITAASAGSRLNAAKLGQIMTFCHNYGPSGLTTSPPHGVTQGYTCRMKQLERHKPIVRLSAVAYSLANVIHHFELKTGYETKKTFPPTAVINHYKFQVWDEFKVKFKRRAATYVADWTDNRNRASKDRVPGLGTTAVRPVDWESRYCEVQDYGLRDYTRSVFGSYNKESKMHLAWE